MGTLPADGSVVLVFDRMLNPFTVTRQSVSIRDAAGNSIGSPIVLYDPVARTVTIANASTGGGGADAGAWLTPNLSYTVTVGIPTSRDDINGIRAIDGATLDPTQAIGTRQFAFKAGMPGGAMPDPVMGFCNDVLPIFQNKCGTGVCHNAPADIPPGGQNQPAAGLVLTSPEGVQHTAIGVPAHGSNTGPVASKESPGAIFGIDYAVVDPGSPGTSWLMYKLLLAPWGDEKQTPLTCGMSAMVSDVSKVIPPADRQLGADERAVLQNFILGREMPFPSKPDDPLTGPPFSTAYLTIEELERIRLWIAQGAQVTACPSCP